MKTILWKIRYCRELRRLLLVSWRYAWQSAGATLEMLDGDITECPIYCAQEERDAWASSI